MTLNIDCISVVWEYLDYETRINLNSVLYPCERFKQKFPKGYVQKHDKLANEQIIRETIMYDYIIEWPPIDNANEENEHQRDMIRTFYAEQHGSSFEEDDEDYIPVGKGPDIIYDEESDDLRKYGIYDKHNRYYY